MKKIKSIVLILSMIFAVSCMDMYNDVADEFEGYNYFLAITNVSANGKITMTSIDKNGSLGKLYEYSPYKTTGTTGFPAAHPSGNYLYIPYYNGGITNVDSYLVVYNINSDGSLTFLQAVVADCPYNVVVHPNGKYVYFPNELGDTISMYKVNDNGKLSKIGTGTVNCGSNPRGTVIDTSGKYLYVACFLDDSIESFSIGSDGSLTQLSSSIPLFSGDSMIVHPNNNYLYGTRFVASGAGSGINSYSIDNEGTLALVNSISTTDDSHLTRIAIHPDGNTVYSTSNISPYSIYVCKVNSSDGSLDSSPLQIFNAGSTFSDVVIHPNGKYLYNSSNHSARVSYNLIASDGTLSLVESYQTSDIGSVGDAYGLTLIRKKK